jgi:hypothetical protein
MGFVMATFAALTVVSAPSLAASTTLLAKVGAQGAVTLTTSAGRRVKTLREGTYVVIVRDRSRTRGFHLVGTGPTQVRRSSGANFVGTVRWRLHLVSGLYRYGSSAQPRLMRRSFRVLSSG